MPPPVISARARFNPSSSRHPAIQYYSSIYISSTPGAAGSQTIPSSTPVGRYLTPARKIPKVRESIDDLPDDYPAHLPLHDSIETHDEFDTDIELSTQELKDDHETKPHPITNKQTQVPTLYSLATFNATIYSPNNISQTPRFRSPDPTEAQGNADPLPEQFSPHRKGQKYVVGGLAAEVRDWLISIDSAVPSCGAPGVHKGKDRDREWLVKMVVDEVSGGGGMGMCLVRGRKMRDVEGVEIVDDSGVVKVMLAGEGIGTGLQRGKDVEVGKVVGIKGPVWEIVIEGRNGVLGGLEGFVMIMDEMRHLGQTQCIIGYYDHATTRPLLLSV
ncbi:hypothetical protein DID88_009055 [Monilinia fructigena]|uniref:Uncharacterized protein n=1 Tax=Monilinia fructigena TaxID=38457 RepID=A0A395IFR3_9HELO|nr:hypothetical protein DID88_009055 [Monilinia fructigena]